ncbi:MAG: hypothetical protein K9H49_20510 [Bacteroidales bacterium]|nr:hypothetical protein [Bacteroidales bacterium]
MKELKLENLSKILPEGFYDIIGYVISSVYLLIGYLYSIDKLEDFEFLKNGKSWVIDLLLVFIVIGGLYLIGTIITFFSSWVFLKTYKWALTRLNPNNKKLFGYWNKKSLVWRIKYSQLIPEMTKRYARLIMIRNIAFVSLILSIYDLSTVNYNYVFLIILVITLITYYFMEIEFGQNYKELKRELKKIEKSK